MTAIFCPFRFCMKSLSMLGHVHYFDLHAVGIEEKCGVIIFIVLRKYLRFVKNLCAKLFSDFIDGIYSLARIRHKSKVVEAGCIAIVRNFLLRLIYKDLGFWSKPKSSLLVHVVVSKTKLFQNRIVEVVRALQVARTKANVMHPPTNYLAFLHIHSFYARPVVFEIIERIRRNKTLLKLIGKPVPFLRTIRI